MDELIPLVGAQHGTFFIKDDTSEGAILRLIAGYGLRADLGGAQPVPARPVADRPGGQDQEADHRDRRAAGLRADLLRAGRRRAGQPDRAAHRVRGPGARRHRGGLVQPVHPGAPGLPGAADGDHRRQREHDHRELADRPPAAGVPAAGRGAAVPHRRAAGQAGGAAAVQRRAGGQGGPAGPAEARHRDQERRDRAGPAGDRGARQAAGPGLPVQVAVPRQRLARAAHPAEQPAHPGPAAGREPGREPDRPSRSSTPR